LIALNPPLLWNLTVPVEYSTLFFSSFRTRKKFLGNVKKVWKYLQVKECSLAD
jgi:hypothetical protein